MRKYLIVAVAAVSAIAITAVSLCPGALIPDLKVSVTPTKAGTTKKPKSTKIHFDIANGDTQTDDVATSRSASRRR